MDNWDPRKEAYNDKNFNSYDRGPGRDIPKNQDKSEGQKLYVTGIPKDLSEPGLTNLFSRAGNVLEVSVVQSKQPNSRLNFGFVKMENLAQAEDAIRQLNNFRLKDSCLRVQIAMSNEEKQRRTKEKLDKTEFLNSLPSNRYSNTRIRGSDSDSDAGSHHSGGPRRIVNGQSNVQMNGHVQGPGPRVHPDPSCMPVQQRTSRLSNRFEQAEFDMMSNASYESHRPHRGRGRGNFNYGPDFAYGNQGYGRGYRDSYSNYSDHQGGYAPPGYGRGRPNAPQTFGRGRPFRDYYPNSSGDFQGYNGYPSNHGGNYRGYNESYGYEDRHQPRHSSPYNQRGGGAGGYNRGQNLDISVRSMPVSKEVKPVVQPRPCHVCKTIGKSQCGKCKTPYCSRKCQCDDWPEHKNVCSEGGRRDDFSQRFEDQFEISVGDDMAEAMKVQIEQTTKEKVAIQKKSPGNAKTGKQQASPRGKDDEQSRPRSRPNQSPQKQPKHSPKQSQPSSTSPAARQEPSPAARQEPSPKTQVQSQDIRYSKLPLNTQTDVMLVEVSSPENIVVQLCDEEQVTGVNELLGRMNDVYGKSSETIQTPNVGMVYAAQFSVDKNWYRARIESVVGDNAEILFIDYGNRENVRWKELRPLKPDMTTLTAAGIICRLDKPSGLTWSSEAKDMLRTLLVPSSISEQFYKVTALSEQNKVYTIKTTGTNGKDVAETLVSKGLCSGAGVQSSVIMSSNIETYYSKLSAGACIQVGIQDKQSPACFYGQVKDEDLVTKFLAFNEVFMTDMAKDTGSDYYRPTKVGEIVFAKFTDGVWYRAEILSLSDETALCLFIDYGNRCDVSFSLIRKATSICTSAPQLAIRMSLAGVAEGMTFSKEALSLFDSLMPMDQLIDVTVKSVNKDNAEVDCKREDGKWLSELLVQSVAMPVSVTFSGDASGSGSVVMAATVAKETLSMDGSKTQGMITHVDMETNLIFLQLAVTEKALQLESIKERMTDMGSKVKSEYKPKVGELVCAKFDEDNIWYRANVLEIHGSNYIVHFVDYGNIALATPATMFKITPDFLELPLQAVCCTVKDISINDLDQEKKQIFATTAMNTIIEVQPCEMKDDVYTVTLYQTDGTNINNLLSCNKNQNVVASESQEPILTASIPMEKVDINGSQIKALLTEMVIDSNLAYLQIYSPECNERLNVFNEKLQIYCQSAKSSYKPKVGELVCVKFSQDGVWYRADVKEVNGDEYRVLFVDYGNMSDVKPESICRITPKFTEMPRQALCCNIVGLDFNKLSQERILEFAQMTLGSKILKLQVLKANNDIYDIKLYSEDGQCINSLFGSYVDDQNSTNDSAKQAVGQGSDVIMASSVPIYPLTLGSKVSQVKIVDICDFDLYFQSDAHGDQSTLNVVSANVQEYCNTNSTPYKPQVGEMVCALFSADNTWYRAEVLQMSGDDYAVRFVDYGNLDAVKSDNIRKMDKSLVEVPKLAFCCRLKGVDSKTMDDEKIKECVTTIAQNQIVLEAVEKVGECYEVILYTSDGQNINQKYITTPASPSGAAALLGKDKIMTLELKRHILPLDGSTCEMQIVDASSMDKIYLNFFDQTMTQQLVAHQLAIQKYCAANAKPYQPTQGELVLTLFNDEWNRANVLDVKDDTYTIQYLDYGNIADVKSDSISKIDQKFAMEPIHGVCCRLQNVDLKSCSQENIQLFAQLAMNQPVLVKAVNESDGCYCIQLLTKDGVNINEQLSTSKKEIILGSSIPKVVLPIGSETNAAIVQVGDDCSFYMQPNIEVALEKLTGILTQCKECATADQTPYTPQKGELVCAFYQDIWYRAIVEDIVNGQFLVHYIDFGNMELTSDKNIRKADASFAKDEAQSVKCVLHNVPGSEEVKNILESLVNVSINVKIIKQEKDIFHVVILYNDLNINEQFQTPVKTPPKEQHSGGARPKVSDQIQKSTSPKNKQSPAQSASGSKYLSLKDAAKWGPAKGKNELVITHVVNPSEFYCQLADKNAIEKLATVMQAMMCRCETEDSDPNFKPQVGDLVCALYQDGGWYRGSVREIYPTNGDYLIYYEDFGNTNIVKADQLRSMLQEYLDLPLRAIKCALPGIVPSTGSTWDDASIEKLKMFMEVTLTGDVLKCENNVYYIKLVYSDGTASIDVCEQLISDCHAKEQAKEESSGKNEADLIQQQIAALQAQLAAMGKK